MIDLKHAQAWGICRICGKAKSGRFLLNFGEEFAHEECAAKAVLPSSSASPTDSWLDCPSAGCWYGYYWLRRGSMETPVMAVKVCGMAGGWKLYQFDNDEEGIGPDVVREGDRFLPIPRPYDPLGKVPSA